MVIQRRINMLQGQNISVFFFFFFFFGGGGGGADFLYSVNCTVARKYT